MKKNSFKFTLLAKATGRRALLGISAMLAAITLAGCSVEDNAIDSTPTYEEEVVYEAPENPLGDFMINFVVSDEAGNPVICGYGESLDEADPSVLSVPVESLEQAEMLFRRFVTDPLHLTSDGNGNMTYAPVTRDGKQQGEIYFTAGADGCLARVTFSDDIPQDLVSEVRFIDQKLWPNNAIQGRFSNVVPEDPLGDFMSHFIKTDEAGNSVVSGLGKVYNVYAPTVLGVPATSLQDASEKFLSCITHKVHLIIEGNEKITYYPVSSDGKQQGIIYFTEGRHEDNYWARVTFSKDIPQDLVSEIHFVYMSVWPFNND